MDEQEDIPPIAVLLYLILVDTAAGSVDTLSNYFVAVAWKMKQLLKLTLGVWNDESVVTFRVLEAAEKWDENPFDGRKYHDEAVEITGTAHTFFWQFFPLGIFASKFAESINMSPVFVFLEEKELELKTLFVGLNVPEDLTVFSALYALVEVLYNNVKASRVFNFVYELFKFVFTCLIALRPSVMLFLIIILAILPKALIDAFERLKEMNYRPRKFLKLLGREG